MKTCLAPYLGETFSKLDLVDAYLQEYSEESKTLTTINTHRGLFQYNRLPFGVSSSPAFFQRIIETILPHIPQTAIYIDDILVTGCTEKKHLQNLNTVLERLQQAGAHLKKEKCHFMLPEVEHLGHLLSAEGLKPSPNNVRAIQLHRH